MLSLLGGIFLGWSLGANDAANVFGTAVSSRMVRFRTAAILAAVFVVIGALISGRAGIETLKGLTPLDLEQAVIASVAAALTVTLMTFLRLPVSTSQAVIGAILGIGIINRQMNMSGLGKVIACWIGTPVGAALFALVLYAVVGSIYNRLALNLFHSDQLIRVLMIATGIYGAYALGANNVANVTAVFVGAGLIDVPAAALIGGLSIAGGILTYSRPVMETVGRKLVRLDPFSALIVVFALAATAHFYTWVGVPVSTSQAVIGGVLGIGLVKGTNTVSRRTLVHIFIGWIVTPLIAACAALLLHISIHLRYVP
jgi:PiT family inorganic phosphate transporter